ncbi:hypothetical protein [Aeromonas caviae]|uniref:hypothetical protein n=1 Tax=Aeromonas caviae TaxID=648 RepID=UPI002B470D23|nr:hypothetical protein [Aeromonas caviae]
MPWSTCDCSRRPAPPARQPAGVSPLALLGTAPFMLRALLTSASVTAILVYVSVSPLVLMTTFGLPPEQYTRLMMAMAGVSMSASFLTPLLLRWLGKARVLALSHLAYLLALLALLCSSGPEGGLSWLLAGCALVCIGFSCGFGVAMGEALDVCGDQVASASALLCIMQIGLSGLFIWGMGYLGMPALWMLILALLLALLGYLVVKVLLPWRAVRRVRARG